MKKLLSILSFVFLAGACAPKNSKDPYSTREGNFLDAFAPARPYEEIFESHTVEKRVHSEFEPVLTAFITLWDTELREAYVKEMKSQFRLQDDAEKHLALEQLSEDESFISFVVSINTREPSWNDLAQPKSMWRVTLETPDASVQVNPDRIKLVSPKDETANYFYKKSSVFTNTYEIRFSRNPFKDAKEFVFHITGTRGAIRASFSK